MTIQEQGFSQTIDKRFSKVLKFKYKISLKGSTYEANDESLAPKYFLECF